MKTKIYESERGTVVEVTDRIANPKNKRFFESQCDCSLFVFDPSVATKEYFKSETGIDLLKEEPMENLIKELKELTHANQHTEARIALAKFIKCKYLVTAYEGIQIIVSGFGFIHLALKDFRNTMDKNLLRLTAEQYPDYINDIKSSL
jgi:hypothetical protein